MKLLGALGRWGGLLTMILLVITLLRQLIALVGFLLIAVKAMIIIAFFGLLLLIAWSIIRDRRGRRYGGEG